MEKLEQIKEIVIRETENKEFRHFGLLPERDELSKDIATKDLTKLIKQYNNLIYDAHSKYINDNFEW